MAEQGEPAPAPVEEGPLGQRLESKTWKTRTEAYEELAKLFEAGDEAAFEEYAESLSKFLKDSNVNAQDKAIEAASAFARKAPTGTIARVAGAMMGVAVDKAFGQAKCKAKAQELAMLLVEAESGEAVA
eukprot:CAMPEP_0174938672 /NCGR_PEP_ID=MMETSP1355-20121228/64220_1 /TAXON_ID=464990 /ORGANISM="Hemiselmis tepida, Strain CCMP443" /LENGTH=128 /DNA_ID=CAMNT_0016185621 /DNA_START=55 /DNA_END=437 /DNA_ORIENTATION=+